MSERRTHYENEPVYLPGLVTASDPVIRGVTFQNCTLQGPAVLRIVSDVEVGHVSFGVADEGPEAFETILWEVPPGQMKVGAIFIQDCRLLGGVTETVGFVGTHEELDVIRRSVGLA